MKKQTIRKINVWMAQRDLNIKGLADLMQYNYQHVHRVMTNQVQPGSKFAEKIAKLTKVVTPAEVMGWE